MRSADAACSDQCGLSPRSLMVDGVRKQPGVHWVFSLVWVSSQCFLYECFDAVIERLKGASDMHMLLVLSHVLCSYYDGDQDKLFADAHVVNPFKPSSAPASLAPPTSAASGSFSSIASRLKSKVSLALLLLISLVYVAWPWPPGECDRRHCVFGLNICVCMLAHVLTLRRVFWLACRQLLVTSAATIS